MRTCYRREDFERVAWVGMQFEKKKVQDRTYSPHVDRLVVGKDSPGFGSTPKWVSRGTNKLLNFPINSDVEIDKFYTWQAISCCWIINHHVIWLDVAMADVPRVQKVNSLEKDPTNVLNQSLVNCFLWVDKLIYILGAAVFKHQVARLHEVVLKKIDWFDNIWVVERFEKIEFVSQSFCFGWIFSVHNFYCQFCILLSLVSAWMHWSWAPFSQNNGGMHCEAIEKLQSGVFVEAELLLKLIW